MVSYLCKIAGVSRSGYYRYHSSKVEIKRTEREKEDLVLKENILKAYHFKGYKKGARQIKMTLQNEFGINYNLKRIRRIMKKYNIVCPIRRPNPYRNIMKATQEHTVVPNLLNREFKQGVPGKVLLTDISYLYYGKGLAYLSTIIDGSTNEVLAYNISSSIKMHLVLDTLSILEKDQKLKLAEEAFIHSDQGAHYTSPIYQKELKKMGLGQSMSRKGNCWDNAPQESFFGHLKSETDIKQCQNLTQLETEIGKYINHYNKTRYQWDLNKMTPVGFRNHLISSAA